MSSAKHGRFAKLDNCATSSSLLLHQSAGLLSPQVPDLASHLAGCDFCAAELYRLSRYGSATYDDGVVNTPLYLRALAEAVRGPRRPHAAGILCEADKSSGLEQ